MRDIRLTMLLQMGGSGIDEGALLSTLQEQPRYYLVADPSTAPEAFARKKFGVYLLDGRILPVYLSEENARVKASTVGAVMPDGEPMTISSSRKALDTLMEQYKTKGLLRYVRVYEKPPFYSQFLATDWLGAESEAIEEPEVEKPQVQATEPEQKEPRCATSVGVDALRKMLDCSNRAEIAKLPTYGYMESFPQILQKLLQVNHCDAEQVNAELGLPEGVTSMIITNPKADLSKRVLKSYLTYFGLEAYLYRYAANSTELLMEIRNSPVISRYSIIPARVSTKEHFELKQIASAKDQNGAWLYRLTLTSAARTETVVVTSPLGMQVGKEYEIEGLEPVVDEALTAEKVAVNATKNPDSVVQAAKAAYEQERRTYEERRRDQVIAYFKNRNPEGIVLNLAQAEKHYERIAQNDALLDEFFWKLAPKGKLVLDEYPEYQRRKANQPKDVEIKGYTAAKLAKEFKLREWEAYFELIELGKTPQKTLERLKTELANKRGGAGN